jgi:hypothetical protein
MQQTDLSSGYLSELGIKFKIPIIANRKFCWEAFSYTVTKFGKFITCAIGAMHANHKFLFGCFTTGRWVV